jgi:OmpA-OmpF porin, OOP family
MSMRKFLFLAASVLVASSANAQDGPTYRSFSPPDQWEVGVHVGLPFVQGDIATKVPGGFGGGLSVRKSLDHVFSVRGTALFATAGNEGEDGDTRTSNTQWLSGGGEVVIALNNLLFNKPYHKLLLDVSAGAGANRFTTDYENVDPGTGTVGNGTYETDGLSTYVSGGAGIAYRVSPKFNIGLQYTTHFVFGQAADRLDGDPNFRSGASVTTYRDALHYPHLRLAFNLGGKDKKTGLTRTEPRYWGNPLDGVGTAIAALEARPIYNPSDVDGDGIIDDIDQEDNTPSGARVDTKGVALDSDGDKLPDYKDKEPFSPPGYTIDAMGVAQVPKPNYVTEADVNRIVDAKLANFKLPQQGVTDWFLPMVNFDLNSYTVRKVEYEKLYQVASVMKANPSIKIVVTGNTDRLSGDTYNNVLSYNRANAVIALLTSQFGISRDRLVLNWAGENANIVPTNGNSLTNRRVEFRVAKNETEMSRPEGPNAGRGRIEGNKSGF